MDQRHLINGIIIIFIIFAIFDLIRYNTELKKVNEFKNWKIVKGKIINVSYESVETSFFCGVPIFFLFIGWIHPYKAYKLMVEYEVNNKTNKSVSFIDRLMDKLDAEKMVSILKNNPNQDINVSPNDDEYYLFLNNENDVMKPYSAGLWIFFAILTYYIYNKYQYYETL